MDQSEVIIIDKGWSFSGHFPASSGTFKVDFRGDGGNSDILHIMISGGQYDSPDGLPTNITIRGNWEIREVIELFKAIEKQT